MAAKDASAPILTPAAETVETCTLKNALMTALYPHV